MLKRIVLIGIISCLLFSIKSDEADVLPILKVSPNHRFFTASGQPFFWLGDTGWLLFSKLNREDAEKYLEIRRQQGFNVIQVMVIHSLSETNAYGDSALINKNITTPNTGNSANNYWSNIDWVLNKAAEKGMYVAMVPIWGSVVKAAHTNKIQAKAYATFLANRYKSYSNVIWMNGGDIAGSDSLKVWNAIGSTLHAIDTAHLITFHPRGRKQSSIWFHNESWLSFNSFQSGHKNYKQDTSKDDFHYGEDNWRYVQVDYNKTPIKPTLDAEPSYEKIPYGLHDINLPKWTDADVRRYGYWSVFAGACGYTYGNCDVMQMHNPKDKAIGAYGSKGLWYNSINDPGAQQMIYLKKLMLSRPYFERVPDQSLIADNQGIKYNRLIATRGTNYALVYTYTGRDMDINTTKLPGSRVKASWYNPRNGNITAIGTFNKSKITKFNPPGTPVNGNDWVLILDAI
ncbi:Putative collagen-binding domain of a collagenase [Mucilaginibacter mallensis]|uniref:Putative collagen-binding domain of a collagenase n=1 Tax=Mucilaginibacter mallensis TaxID=652787 RepID=A0A1H1Y6P3_MUCMA|nr:glycoside hydrolase family 140 protein [Mucilaginibacter mallensis]SDT17071.1 Putative collagen-binding domain of a collagenase [Mucilaginibacter mallensis]